MDFIKDFKYIITTKDGIFDLVYLNPINHQELGLIHLFEMDSDIDGARAYKVVIDNEIKQTVTVPII